jgi:two-component system, chemotaxis family, chemotaxis protein CheY
LFGKILIVDDEAETRDFLTFILSRAGYTVIQAKDGLEGLTQVQENHPDLILSDITMPNLDGIEMVRRLRQLPNFKRIPILVMSAFGMGKLTEAMAAGADYTMLKPVNCASLIETVRKIIG